MALGLGAEAGVWACAPWLSTVGLAEGPDVDPGEPPAEVRRPPWSSVGLEVEDEVGWSSETPGVRSPPLSSPGSTVREGVREVELEDGAREVELSSTTCALDGTRTGSAPEKEALPSSP